MRRDRRWTAAICSLALRLVQSPAIVTTCVLLALSATVLTLPHLAQNVRRPDERGVGWLAGGHPPDLSHAVVQQSVACLRSTPGEDGELPEHPLLARWAPFFSDAEEREVQHFDLGARVPSRGAPPSEAVVLAVSSRSRIGGCLAGAMVASLLHSASFPRSKDVVVLSLPGTQAESAGLLRALVGRSKGKLPLGAGARQVLARKVSVVVSVEEAESSDPRVPAVQLGVHAGAVVGAVPNLDLVLAASTVYRCVAIGVGGGEERGGEGCICRSCFCGGDLTRHRAVCFEIVQRRAGDSSSTNISYAQALQRTWMQAWEQVVSPFAVYRALDGGPPGFCLFPSLL